MEQQSITQSRWILFTTLGWVVGIALAVLFAESLDVLHLEYFGLGLGVATGIGFMQFLALRKVNGMNIRWMIFTIVGIGSTFLFFNLVLMKVDLNMEGVPGIILMILAASLGGLFTGYLQQRGRWMWYSFGGWAMCSVLISSYGLIVAPMHLEQTAVGALFNVLAMLIGGLVIGIVTGKGITGVKSQ